MPRLYTFLICTLLIISTVALRSQSAPIAIDGLFDDWTGGLATHVDPPETQSGIDLLNFQVSNDETFLFIRFELDSEIDLTDNLFSHDLRLYIDADNNAATGFNAQTGYGSELGIDFNDLLAYYDVVPATQVNFVDIRLRVGPTVSGTEFEIAIGRNSIPDGVNPLFPSPTIKVLFQELNGGDSMPNDGDTFTYTFDETPIAPVNEVDIPKDDTDLIRTVYYNTLANGLIDGSRVGHFETIITLLNPDIIGFSECGGTTEGDVKALMDAWLPLGTIDGWYVDKDDGDLITASRWPIINSWAYIEKQFGSLIDLPGSYPGDLLFVNSHLSCCANDAQRQNQADEFVQFIQDAKTPGGFITLDNETPIIYGGDLNLVGYAQQLTTLLTGDIQDNGTYGPDGPMDWDGSDFTDQICMQTDKRMAYTWRNDSEAAFPPGRLDFIIYSDAVIAAAKSFTIQTEVMSPERLAFYGLDALETSSASDHFPVTADFSFELVVDADGDGILDVDDNCPAIFNPGQDDFDLDGVGDFCDGCPFDPLKTEPGICGCGIVDIDLDGDLVIECIDNCPGDLNPGQEDWNGNGIGDMCEDSDSDGLSDDDEINVYNTDPGSSDTDMDGLEDGFEVEIILSDPLLQDSDGDGLTDGLEQNVALTSPTNPDTDGDGCNDAQEFNLDCPDSTCDDCPGDFDQDGLITTIDLLGFLSAFGNPCN